MAEQQVGTAEGATGPEDRARLAAFGLRIKLLRVSRGWSQEQLAEAAGMHRTFIGQVERGQRGLNVLGLWRLAGAFNVSIGDLFVDPDGKPIPLTALAPRPRHRERRPAVRVSEVGAGSGRDDGRVRQIAGAAKVGRSGAGRGLWSGAVRGG